MIFFLLCLLTSKKIKKLRFKLPYDILTWVMQNCGNFWNQCEQNLFVSISSGNQNIQRWFFALCGPLKGYLNKWFKEGWGRKSLVWVNCPKLFLKRSDKTETVTGLRRMMGHGVHQLDVVIWWSWCTLHANTGHWFCTYWEARLWRCRFVAFAL